MIDAHKLQETVQKRFAKSDLDNLNIKIKEADKVSKRANDKQDQLEIGVSLCETNPSLIPLSSNEKAINKCYERFKKECAASSTSVLGPRQYRQCIIMTIKHFLKIVASSVISNSDFEFTDSTSKSQLDAKLSRAILLYSQFEKEIRAQVSFG